MGHLQDTPDSPSEEDPDGTGSGSPTWLGGIRARLSRLATGADRRGSGPRPVEAGANPILHTATPLLALMLRLSELPPPPNPEDLRHRIIAALRRFPSAARAAGMPPDQMRAAHFILCAALDDIIGDTAWGQRTGWSECCLTRTFYQSLEPGPSLLTLLQHIRGEPDRHRNELELFSVCLALGFEGDTRTQANGAVEFRRRREDINALIAAARGPAAGLSPSWPGVPPPRPPPGAVLPVWVTAAVTGALLTGLYALLAFSLGSEIDGACRQLAALLPDRPALIGPAEPGARAGPPAAGATTVVRAPSARAGRLRDALAGETAIGQIEVVTTDAGDVIRIPTSLAFGRADDTLSGPGHDLAEHLVVVLDRESGHIQVVGHTDDSFVPTLRFPSGTALTEAQARAFARVLVAHLRAPERVEIEGSADGGPLPPAAGPTDRNRNGRIEIILAPAESGR
jgi:type VI secretion system protein ImpK